MSNVLAASGENRRKRELFLLFRLLRAYSEVWGTKKQRRKIIGSMNPPVVKNAGRTNC